MTDADRLALVVADVFELAGALRRSGDDLAGEVGQTQARWQLLSVLSEGRWTASDAARRLGVTRQALLHAKPTASVRTSPRRPQRQWC